MQDKAHELLELIEKVGFKKGTEQYEVCARALKFLGTPYLRTEELAGTTVDCSTLTSQSHWEGALIGIPFIADRQRQAASGITIPSVDEAIPGDVLVKYPSVDEAPDKTYNHVGIYLGRDQAGDPWLIESRGDVGVIVSRLEDFNPQGGIKRFTLSREAYDNPLAHKALQFAPLVPKFGRLGVRQYRQSSSDRPFHKGIDIYMPRGTAVLATIGGIATPIRNELELCQGIEIASDMFPETSVRYLMLDNLQVKEGIRVRARDLIGFITTPSDESDIKYPDVGDKSHLHLEVEVKHSPNLDPRGGAVREGMIFHNHLYLSKIGVLPLPFK